MAIYRRPDLICCSDCDADVADPDPAVVGVEGIDFDFYSDTTEPDE